MTDTNNNTSSSSTAESAMEKMMARGFSELGNANRNANGDEKTVKLLGMIEVPEMFATVVEGLWNEASGEATKWLQHKSFPKFHAAGQALGLQGSKLTHSATVATVLLNTGVKSLMYINPIRDAYKAQHAARKEMAQSIAPLLDDMKGKHSISALMQVKADDNEMIYFARQRMNMQSAAELKNKVAKLVVNVLPSIVVELPQHKRMWNGDPSPAVEVPLSGVSSWVNRIVHFGTAPVADTIVKSNERALKKKFTSPYCALDMVRELEKQVIDNPEASSFQLPGRNGGSISLESYIEKTIFQHQKDMSDISADHTEIRTALKEDVIAVAKPLAEAIRKGDISALSLVDMIGKGKIVKNRGRSVASADEVQTLIERAAPKQATMMHVDPKEYYKDAPFTRDDLKASLKALEGEEKHHFAVLFPDAVLEEAGMPVAEIKEMRTATGQTFERMLADAVIGLQAKSDEELKTAGLAKNEITFLRTAFKKIEHEGVDGIHELKSSPTNERGIERLVANMAVSQTVKGSKTYLGTLIKEGHAKFDEVASERKNDEGRGARKTKSASREEAEDMDDDDRSEGFRDRETRRNSNSRDYAERDY